MSTLFLWKIVDLDPPDFVEGSHIPKLVETEQELRQELETKLSTSPRVVRMSNGAGIGVSLGIGGPSGFVRVDMGDNEARKFFIHKPHAVSHTSEANFSCFGQPHIVQPEYLDEPMNCIDIAVAICRGEELQSTFVDFGR
jgi:hypothetical protein